MVHMPYRMPTYKVLELLQVDPECGVRSQEIDARRAQYGANEFEEEKKESVFSMFLDQLRDPMIIILLAGAFISAFLRELVDAGIIVAVIALNALIGVMQQYRSEKALEALKDMSSPRTKVLRDATFQQIDSRELVVGDLVFLETGNIVPADLRLLETVSFKCEESTLSGESDSIEKDATLLYQEEKNPADQRNMAFMTTVVTSGHACGIVVRCAKESEVGQIASMLKERDDVRTPLQERLAHLSAVLGIMALVICALMFIIGIFQGKGILDMLLLSISLAVAAIPEGLPAVVTIVLAFGVQAMSGRNAIVRRLHAVETLGSVNVICSDKTGTLTMNQMRVAHVFCLDSAPPDPHLLACAVLCNNAQLGENEIGEPMESALLRYAQEQGISVRKMRERCPQLHEIPFDSTRKRMCSVHQTPQGTIMYMKGALERVLPLCDRAVMNGRTVRLTAALRGEIQEEGAKYAAQAERVLAFAWRSGADVEKEEEMIFAGLITFVDPPRPEAASSIAAAQGAGIKVVMITGDHPLTAFAIARQLNIAQHEDQVMSGSELDALDDEQLQRRLGDIRVFARVTPAHKVRIVEAFRREGDVVSMSGDGVNDAPSLKKADIGIAMGKNGSDVCRQASDMILTDDRFATIVDAVSEGRHLYMNIQKAVIYLLSCNLGEIMSLFLAVICLPAVGAPLRAVQILWINLVTDAFPALALGVDPKENDVMRQPPRARSESLFAHGRMSYTVLNGMFIGTMTLVAFRWGLQRDLAHAQSMAFMVLSMSQLFHALNLRSLEHSLFRAGPFKNRWLILTVLFGIVLQVIVCELPAAQLLLGTVHLDGMSWAVVFVLSASVIAINEFAKLFHSAR